MYVDTGFGTGGEGESEFNVGESVISHVFKFSSCLSQSLTYRYLILITGAMEPGAQVSPQFSHFVPRISQ